MLLPEKVPSVFSADCEAFRRYTHSSRFKATMMSLD